MSRFKKIHHVSLCVRDIEKAKHFYSNVLGFEELERPPFDFNGAWYDVGGQQLHLLELNGETLREGGINSRDGHFAIWVEDHDETAAWLTSIGVEHDARPYGKTDFAQIFLTDVDNNIIEFDSPRPKRA